MQAYELADLAINTQVRLDTSWALFLSINSSIIGGVVFIERKFSLLEKAAVALIYSVLILLNYTVTHNSFLMLKSVYADLIKFDYTPNQPGYEVISHYSYVMTESAFWSHPGLIPNVYIGAAIIIMLAVIFDEYFTRTAPNKH